MPPAPKLGLSYSYLHSCVGLICRVHLETAELSQYPASPHTLDLHHSIIAFCSSLPIHIMAAGDNLPNRRAEMLSVQITMAVLAMLAVVLRLISRFLVVRNPGWDDYIMIMGTVGCHTSTLNVLIANLPAPQFDAGVPHAVLSSPRRSHAHGRYHQNLFHERFNIHPEGIFTVLIATRILPYM